MCLDVFDAEWGTHRQIALNNEGLRIMNYIVGETGASCYRGRLLQGHFIRASDFMQNSYIDGEIAGSSFILIHQGNHSVTKQNHRRTRIIRDTDTDHFLYP